MKQSDDNRKKQVPLRLSSTLCDELMRWAEEDFRSLNGQIEFLLTECVRKRRKGGGTSSAKKKGGNDDSAD